jgi:hypothetical protein
VVDLEQEFIGIERAGYVTLPDISRHVRLRNVLVDDSHGHGIQPVGADEAGHAVTLEGLPGRRIRRNSLGLAEIAGSLERCWNDGIVQERARGLAQA